MKYELLKSVSYQNTEDYLRLYINIKEVAKIRGADVAKLDFFTA